MMDLRDLRVPGLGLAPMTPTDTFDRRDRDPRIAAYVRSHGFSMSLAAMLARLRTALQLGGPAEGTWRAPQTQPRRGFTFGHLAR